MEELNVPYSHTILFAEMLDHKIDKKWWVRYIRLKYQRCHRKKVLGNALKRNGQQ